MRTIKSTCATLLCCGFIFYSQSFAQWGPGGVRFPTSFLLAADSILFAACTDYAVCATTDEGQTWTVLDDGLVLREISMLARNPSFLFGATSSDVFRSTNNGMTWALANWGLPPWTLFSKITSILAFDSFVFVATTKDGGIYASSDNGMVWLPSNVGLISLDVSALIQLRGHFFAATGAGVFRSDDNGKNWTYASEGITDSIFSSFGARDSVVFAGTAHGGVFRSTNLGISWVQRNSGLDYGRGANLIGTDGANLFASANGHLFISRNDGDSWTTTIEDGLPSPFYPTSIAFIGPYIFVGGGGGVYRRPYSEIASVARGRGELPTEPRLEQNYPNPFNPSTTITYELPRASFVTLSVYDMLGREVSVLANERREAGVHEVKFNGSGLSSGVYLYRIQAGTFVQTRKLLFLR